MIAALTLIVLTALWSSALLDERDRTYPLTYERPTP